MVESLERKRVERSEDQVVQAARQLTETALKRVAQGRTESLTGFDTQRITLARDEKVMYQIVRRDTPGWDAGHLWIYTSEITKNESGAEQKVYSHIELPRSNDVTHQNIKHLTANRPADELLYMAHAFEEMQTHLTNAVPVSDKEFRKAPQSPEKKKVVFGQIFDRATQKVRRPKSAA